MSLDAILTLHRASSGPTLVVDPGPVADALGGEGAFLLSRTNRSPDELWSLPGTGKLGLVVFSAERSSREIYRMLVHAERLVMPGGKILLAHPDDSAVVTFCAVYLNWSWMLVDGMYVLQKSVVVQKAELFRGEKLRVEGKRVISLSVFGPDGEHGYWRHLPTVIRAYLVLFPGYEIRIHHDDWIYKSEYGDVLHGLARRGVVKLVRMAADGIAEGKCKAMLWRLAPCWDPEVDYVFCRDVDSLPTWRDRMCCEEFIASDGCDVGTIHDDPQHVGIMGGLCHFRAGYLRMANIGWQQFIDASGYTDEQWGTHGADQAWLNTIVEAWKPVVLEHSLFTVVGEAGREHRAGSMFDRAVFKTEIVNPSAEVFESVPEAARLASDSFVNYLGAAGMWREGAKQFYASVSERTMEVDAAEEMAGWGSFRGADGMFPGGMRPVNRVVLSSDTNLDYAFYAPVVTRAWMQRGYRPLLFLVGTVEQWFADPRLRLALQRSREAGAVIHFVPEVEGVRTSTVAQCVRIFGTLAPGVDGDDYLITSDIDMLPLGPWVGGGRAGDFTVWYANAYADKGYPHWPMCYVGARAKAWRETFCTTEETTFVDRLRVTLERAPKEASEAWGYDEIYMSARLADRPRHLVLALLPRTFVEGEWRIDRSDWDGAMAEVLKRGNLNGVADAHLPRPGFGADWEKIAPLLRLALSPSDFAWCEEYRNAWEAAP